MKNIAILIVALIAPLFLFACVQAQLQADATRQAAHIGGDYAIQKGIATVSDLQSLAKDLPGVASGIPLTPADNRILAGFVAGLANAKVDLVQVGIISGLNQTISDVQSSKQPPTALTGALWQNLTDVAMGLNDAATDATNNPDLVPKS